jgi:hypothetical protein
LLTDTEIIDRHRARFRALADLHGGTARIPAEDTAHCFEIMRAEHVIQKAQRNNTDIVQTLREHGISAAAIAELGIDLDAASTKRAKRADKYQSVFKWCEEHPGHTTTAQEIADIGGFSVATATTLIRDRVDLFHKVKRGQYLVRNPAAERAAAK